MHELTKQILEALQEWKKTKSQLKAAEDAVNHYKRKVQKSRNKVNDLFRQVPNSDMSFEERVQIELEEEAIRIQHLTNKT